MFFLDSFSTLLGNLMLTHFHLFRAIWNTHTHTTILMIFSRNVVKATVFQLDGLFILVYRAQGPDGGDEMKIFKNTHNTV